MHDLAKEDGYLGGVLDADEGQVVEAEVESLSHGWKARQAWGFEDLYGNGNGSKWFVRRVVTSKGESRVETRLAYGFEGE